MAGVYRILPVEDCWQSLPRTLANAYLDGSVLLEGFHAVQKETEDGWVHAFLVDDPSLAAEVLGLLNSPTLAPEVDAGSAGAALEDQVGR